MPYPYQSRLGVDDDDDDATRLKVLKIPEAWLVRASPAVDNAKSSSIPLPPSIKLSAAAESLYS
ncbi:isoflavone reductase family protein [Colletotrichum higginsianum]|nr:isoflavone reductase family protein [Colletotrichum higginsianum]